MRDHDAEAGSSCSSCSSCSVEGCPSRGQDNAAQGCSQKIVRMSLVKHKIIVMSGKGGVGKSTVAVNLATSLAASGLRVGLLDVDIHGPSIPTMLGVGAVQVEGDDRGYAPVDCGGIKVMSIGFLLPHPDKAVVWRGPVKMGVIKQFIEEVAWGELDCLVIDSPPGTGDEPLSVCQIIGDLDGAVIVTTPQKVAAVDVRKSITFCHQMKLPVLGIVENMSGFACPHCGEVTQILPAGGGREIALDMMVPFLGAIPMDPAIAASGDGGRAFIEAHASSAVAQKIRDAFAPLVEMCKSPGPGNRGG